MASVKASSSAVEPGHEMKVLEELKERNDVIDDMLEKVRSFWNLEDKYDRDSLSKLAFPAGKFAAEQIDIALKLRHKIEEKISTLEICLVGGHPIPYQNYCFGDLVSEIETFQQCIPIIINDIEKNQDAHAFMQAIQNLANVEDEEE